MKRIFALLLCILMLASLFPVSALADDVQGEDPCAEGHSYNDGVTTPPSCTAAGYTTFTCSRCGDSYTTEGEAALGHSYDDGVATDPTCTAAGYTTFTCSRCGDSYRVEGEAALGHSYNDGVATDPTCTEAGFTTFTCSRCGNSYTTEGEAALGHDYDDGVVTDPTCTEAGFTTFTCSRCGDTYTTDGEAALGHSYNDGVVTDPTCTEAGFTTFTCSRCGDSYTTEGEAALGHSYDDGVATDPTCTEAGYTTFTCSRCGDSYTTEGEAALDHDYGDGIMTDPSCTAAGFTTFTCSRCGDSYTTEGEAALGHDYDEGVVTTDPTAEKEGVKTFTCSRCGDTYTEPVPKLEVAYPAFSQSRTVSGVTVSVSAPEGVFPEGAKLSVTAVPAATAERDDNVNVALSFTFDIKVLDKDGEEVQPKDEQNVTVAFSLAAVADENLETQVYHIDDSGSASALDVDTAGQTAVVETDSFSLYQVEFTYEKKQYVLPGDQSVPLSEILKEVGLVGEVTDVQCSNTKLFSASRETGEWVVTTHQAFSSTEWMKVTINGLVYEITITDAQETIGGFTLDVDETNKTATITGYSGTGGNLMIPDTLGEYAVTGIAASAFQDNSSITNLTIPATITGIGANAFSGCGNLQTVLFNDGSTGISIGANAFSGCSKLTTVTLSDRITAIPSSMFQGCSNLTTVTFPFKLASIGANAFYGCSSLTSGDLSSLTDLTSIGASAFQGCSSLTGLKLPTAKNLSIGDSAYSGCSSITNLTIPANVTDIGNEAFYRCTGLTGVAFAGGNTSINIGENAFGLCTGLTTVTLSDRVTAIPSSMFQACLNITTVTFPAKLASIGDNAFDGCGKLTTGDLSATELTSIGADAFQSCISLAGLKLPTGKPLSIGDRAFYGCSSIASLTIPPNVTGIGNRAFSGCPNLTTVTFEAGNTSINIGEYAFEGCGGLTTATLSDRVTAISNSMFERCVSLESVTIPNSVTTIGDYAFDSCGSLTSVTIPASVMNIGECAFQSCSNLRSVTIQRGDTNALVLGYGVFNVVPTDQATLSWTGAVPGDQDPVFTVTPDSAGYSIVNNTRLFWNGTTEEATLTASFAAAPTISTQPGSLSWTYGDTTVRTLSVAASVDDGGTLTYQWYQNTSASNTGGTEATGATATASEYTVPSGTETNAGTYYYYCVVTNTNNGDTASTVSNVATVTVNKAPLTITAKDQIYEYNGQTQGPGDMAYDDAAEIAEVITADGLQGNDEVTSVTVDGQGTTVGTYPLEPSAAAIGKDGTKTNNYSISYENGTLRIANKYTVTVTASPEAGGTVTGGGSYLTSTEVTLTATPKTGYRFKEWQVVSGGVTIQDGKFTMGEKDVEVKAVFEAIAYPVTVSVNDSAMGTASASPASGPEGTEVTLTASPKSGYQFKEWQVVSGGVTVKDSKFTIGTSDVEVKAVFEVIPAGKVTVTFDANGHGTAPAAQQIEKGGKASKPADLTAKGWVFGGWYTSKDCKTAFDFSKAVNADTTVYAKWTKVVYTVVEGDFTRWWKGGLEGVSITVKRSPDDENCYAHFDSVDIDGKTLADSAYKAKKGSTVVYLKPATLEKLSLGRHTVTIVFDDGSAEAVVSIHRPHHGPKTGDGSTPGTWAALMLLSGCGFFSIVYTFSKKARKKET